MTPRQLACVLAVIVVAAFGLARPAASSTAASPRVAGVVGAGPGATAGPSRVYSFGVVGEGFGGKLTQLEHRTPTLITGITGEVVEVATSNSDSYALTSSGTVWAWGADSVGELGDGTTTAFVRAPVPVRFPAGVKISSLANPMPYDSGLAIDSHGDAWGWGFNWDHTLCLPSTEVLVPARLPLDDVTLATGAGAHTLFESNGKVYACGRGTDGELGDGSTANRSAPTAVVGLPLGGVKSLASSWQGSGALMDDGSYYDWGFNVGGQLGDGGTTNSSLPVRVPLPLPVTEVSQGGSRYFNGQTLAILSDGSVWAWGDGDWGQLGDGRLSSSAVPVRVQLPAGVRFTQVCSGGDSAYVLDSSGRLWVWGANDSGQLGGDRSLIQPTPLSIGLVLTQVSSTATNVAGLEVS